MKIKSCTQHHIYNTNYREESIRKIKSIKPSEITSINIEQLARENNNKVYMISDSFKISNFINKLQTIEDHSESFGKIGGEERYSADFYSKGSLLFSSTILIKNTGAAIFVKFDDNKVSINLDNIIGQEGLKDAFRELLRTVPNESY